MRSWPFLQSNLTTHITRANGLYLYTKDGKQILDAAGGAIVSNIGHGRAEVAEAIAKATLHLTYVIPLCLTDERAELMDCLVNDWLPDSMTPAYLTCGGSEAVESAIKIAIQYYAAKGKLHKCKILGRSISYHGTTILASAVGRHIARRKGLEHALPHYPVCETPYLLRCTAEDPVEYYVNSLTETIKEEGADNIAALIAEPIVGASGGAMVPPDGYWEAVRSLCGEHDILLIMDEVMTGFGRTGVDFGFQHWPIEPDIFLGGKGLTGGYAPLTAVFTTNDIVTTIEQAGFDVMFHTYAAHPAACAAASTVLKIIKNENLVERAAAMGKKLEKSLKSAFSNHPHVAESRGCGLLHAIEVVKDRSTLEMFPAERDITLKIVRRAQGKGVLFYPGGTGVVRDVVLIGPAFTIEEDHISQLVETLVDAVDFAVAN